MSLEKERGERKLNIENPKYAKENLAIKDLLDFRYHRKDSLAPVKWWHAELFSRLLEYFQWFEWFDIAFQYTTKWWKIVSHEHTWKDATDELILLLEWSYWDIWKFETKNWMMRIASWEQHWWNSHWTWISIKPRLYTFVEENENWIIYEKWGKNFLISRWKISEKHKSLYIKNLLLISLWTDKIDIGKIHFDNLREQNWDFILIWEID